MSVTGSAKDMDVTPRIQQAVHDGLQQVWPGFPTVSIFLTQSRPTARNLSSP